MRSAPRSRPNPQVTEIHAGSVIKGTDWTITVGHAQHVQPYLECLAFRIDTKEGSICYTGDSGVADSIVDTLALTRPSFIRSSPQITVPS